MPSIKLKNNELDHPSTASQSSREVGVIGT